MWGISAIDVWNVCCEGFFSEFLEGRWFLLLGRCGVLWWNMDSVLIKFALHFFFREVTRAYVGACIVEVWMVSWWTSSGVGCYWRDPKVAGFFNSLLVTLFGVFSFDGLGAFLLEGEFGLLTKFCWGLILEGLLLAGSVACFSKTEGFALEGLSVCCASLKVMRNDDFGEFAFGGWGFCCWYLEWCVDDGF